MLKNNVNKGKKLKMNKLIEKIKNTEINQQTSNSNFNRLLQ